MAKPPDLSESTDNEEAGLFAAFLEQWHAGEARIEDLCERHPEHKDVFHRWWSRLVTVGEVTTGGEVARTAGPKTRRLGRFELLEEIGRGGQGTVYLAEDTRLRRRVALKVLVGFDTTSGERTARFVREAEMAARLDHPGLCTVYEAGVEDDVPYISMRYVEGETLADRIEQTRSQSSSSGLGTSREFLNDTLLMAEQIARALHAAHEAHLIHRDIKPRNIMVTKEGVPVILDFGLARDLGGDLTTLTATGQVFGTPAYMSPEQVSGQVESLDGRTDIFSLGTTIYELLTLRRPFEAPTREGLSRAILAHEPSDPRKIDPTLPADLSVVLLTALDKDPNRRYATALDFAEDLRRVRVSEPILARPAGPLLRLKRWAVRRPAVATTSAALFVLLVGGIALTSFFLAEARRLNADYRLMADTKRLETIKEDAETFLPLTEDKRAALETWLDQARRLLSRLPVHRSKLRALQSQAQRVEPEEGSSSRWRFEDSELQWRHDVIAELVEDLESFSDRQTGLFARVEEWLDFVETVRDCTLVKSAAAWEAAMASIADQALCPDYEGLSVAPQLGLIPIGRNPHSELWEFAHLRTGVPAERRPDGSLIVTEDTGLVFVLLPGGTFDMGSDTPWPGRAGGEFRVAAEREGPRHQVTLAPFFLSKYEMTQGQWTRFTSRNPSGYPPEVEIRGHRATLAHPIESVSWNECARLAREMGLLLPTEAQWEYAARAGTTTAWSTGQRVRSVTGYANLADAFAKREIPVGFEFWEKWLEDGHVLTAPVGHYRPNLFGLHDMIGNVREWCRDRFGLYSQFKPRPGDGERICKAPARVFRGGSFRYPADVARSAQRFALQPDRSQDDLGLRPALSLRP